MLGLATAMCAGNYVLCTNGRHKTKDENEQDQNNLKGYNKGSHASEYEQLKFETTGVLNTIWNKIKLLYARESYQQTELLSS